MSNCDHIDSLVTPYIDGELPAHDHALVEEHLRACAPCRARVTAEQTVCHLVHRRRTELQQVQAPASLRAKMALARPRPTVVSFPAATSSATTAAPTMPPTMSPAAASPSFTSVAAARAAAHRPFSYRRLAIAALFVLVVGGAVTYRATVGATQAMAAELAADHMKCFMVNNVLHTHESVADVEAYMRSGFDWPVTLPTPQQAAGAALEVVGSRPCFYEHGKVAHIMYHHKGLPVSIFMLPGVEYERSLVRAMGHDAVVWAEEGRTFVVIAQAPRADVERIATFVQASLH